MPSLIICRRALVDTAGDLPTSGKTAPLHGNGLCMRHISVIVLLSVIPSSAWAGTVERVVRLDSGDSRTLPIGQPARVHVDDNEVVSAQVEEEDDLRLEGLRTGETIVFLHGDRGSSAWRVLVDVSPDGRAREEAVAAAGEACGDLEENAEGIEVTVASASCHEALVALSSHLTSEELSLRFNEQGVRAQLAAQHARLSEDHPELAARLTLAYLGAILLIRGSLPGRDESDAVWRSIWRATAGRLLVDLDNLEIGAEAR